MKLFKYEDYKVTISEEALTLKPFKQIWNRDRSQSKDKAMSELSFIYFMQDPRSDFQYIVDEDERAEAIKQAEGFPDNWKPDKLVNEAMSFYASFKPTAALLLEDTRVAVDKLRKLLRDIDLSATDSNGKPIYTLNTITATIKQVPILAKDLDEAEKVLAAELKSQGKMRGSGEKKLFEDGFNF